MQILIHADSHIEVGTDLVQVIEEGLEHQLRRFSGQLMRVDVHLADVTATHFEVNDKECTLRIHIARRSVLAVSDRAPSSVLAVEGALAKAARLLDADAERQSGHPGTATIRRMRADGSLA